MGASFSSLGIRSEISSKNSERRKDIFALFPTA